MEDTGKSKILKYWPLAALILVALLAACAITHWTQGDGVDWMHAFMGFIFCQFALLKLFDIPGFADGFSMYDLVAKQVRAYAYLYPFIELALGLLYFSHLYPIATYLLTIFFMALGSAGVIMGLRKGLDIYCPCMGTVLKVPLSTVTLAEDIGMGVMALALLIQRFS